MTARRAIVLPPSLAPIGLSREEAAAFVGISATLFDRLVAGGAMPEPRLLAGRLVWDTDEVAKAFRQAPHRADRVDGATGDSNPWN